MGCSYDKLGVNLEKREHIKIFVETFNELLKDELYDGEDGLLTADHFEPDGFGGYELIIDKEPLFYTMENGAQLVDVVTQFLEKLPDCEFHMWYECIFNNCGAIVYTTYDYVNYELTVVDKSSEESGAEYCNECDWCAYEDDDFDEDDICTIDKYEPGMEFICPECGSIIEWEVFVNKKTIRMIDGHLDGDIDNLDCAEEDGVGNDAGT